MYGYKSKKLPQAMLYIILFGIVSLFSDMTHEGASRIRGAYLSLLDASAATIGFIFGLGVLIGYSFIIMHVSRTYSHLASGLSETTSLVNSGTLPLLYASAMLVDAVAALVFGLMYDKKGVRALVWSTVISAPFAVFVFSLNSVPALLFGIALWGVGMGAQESILKAAVTSMVPKTSRATGYGIFECSFGFFWFLGSWLMGVLYDTSIPVMVVVSVAAQLAAIPLYIASAKLRKQS